MRSSRTWVSRAAQRPQTQQRLYGPGHRRPGPQNAHDLRRGRVAVNHTRYRSRTSGSRSMVDRGAGQRRGIFLTHTAATRARTVPAPRPSTPGAWPNAHAIFAVTRALGRAARRARRPGVDAQLIGPGRPWPRASSASVRPALALRGGLYPRQAGTRNSSGEPALGFQPANVRGIRPKRSRCWTTITTGAEPGA